MAIKYERRNGPKQTTRQSELNGFGEVTQTSAYATYELWAIHEDGTQVFMCAVFGGCSDMVIEMTRTHFERLHE